MDKHAGALLSRLDGEIDRKCLEIRRENRNRALRSAFLGACALFLLIPALLVFLGASLGTFCIPAAFFLSAGFCLLSPLIFGRKSGGSEHEPL
ncbi:MAG: hypothetical protein LKJ21_08665 [Oscillospiraceae bacterium]|nr:hypothetical protein [Oscillospiraceae bacterium]MCI1990711.1 hypothetical protein [Oscillospiraceae bacterium]MCI2035455.1 hypothetical protein [Oscillospiraceae bacterium]